MTHAYKSADFMHFPSPAKANLIIRLNFCFFSLLALEGHLEQRKNPPVEEVLERVLSMLSRNKVILRTFYIQLVVKNPVLYQLKTLRNLQLLKQTSNLLLKTVKQTLKSLQHLNLRKPL